MKRCIRLTLTLTLGLIVTGCGSITFVQYEQPGNHKTVNHWHDSTLNGMVEIRKPLDVRTICGKKAWTKITTEHTFYNLLVTALIPTAGPISFYSVWTNKVQCHKGNADTADSAESNTQNTDQ